MLSRWDIKGAASALLVLARRLRLEGRSDEHTAAKALSAYGEFVALFCVSFARQRHNDVTDRAVRIRVSGNSQHVDGRHHGLEDSQAYYIRD